MHLPHGSTNRVLGPDRYCAFRPDTLVAERIASGFSHRFIKPASRKRRRDASCVPIYCTVILTDMDASYRFIERSNVGTTMQPLIDPGSIRPASVRSVLSQLALALKMAAISASDISSGCFLVCSLRSIHNPASLACAVVAVIRPARRQRGVAISFRIFSPFAYLA